MRFAARFYQLAAARPVEALNDVLGLAAICAMVFAGFAATSLA
ncbi:MAG: hypothetical protein ACK5MQ_06405 [Pikeienuella sp.]